MPDVEQTYLIFYDIADAKRLRRVHKICKCYGLPQQYSVFEARMSRRKYLRFLREITPELKQSEDQLVCMPICVKCRDKLNVIGTNWDLTHEEPCIII